MSTRKLAQLIFAAALLAEPLLAQQKGDSSPCMAEYENHNQIDYGPLIAQEVKGTFAWDPFNDHKTVVRGGYGVFYSPIYAQIPYVVKTLGDINGVRQIANAVVSILGVPPANSAEIYGALFPKILCGQPPAGENSCITRDDLAPFIPISNTGPLPPGTALFFGQSDYRNPQSQQASLGVERELGNGFSVAASYIYVHTTHLPWAIDKNLLPGAPIVSEGGAQMAFPLMDFHSKTGDRDNV